jgi:hypothetical protein
MVYVTDKVKIGTQKGMPVGAGGLAPPFYF